MKIGICPKCHKEFKITKFEKLYKHGYKRELKRKIWHGIVTFTKTYYKITSPPCGGSGLLAVRVKEE